MYLFSSERVESETIIASLIAAIALVLSGCGGTTPMTDPPLAPSPDLAPSGSICGNRICEAGESASSCCDDCPCAGGATCVAHQCVRSLPPPSDMALACMPVNASCNVQTDCCDYDRGTGYCVNFGGGAHCTETCTVNSDCVSNCCQTTNQGHQVCAPTGDCIGQALGAPCTTNNECASGLCVNGGSGQGWCSERCTSNTACPSSPVMWCAQNNAGVDICWRGCSSNSDCTPYGPAATCQSVTTIDGYVTNVCVG